MSGWTWEAPPAPRCKEGDLAMVWRNTRNRGDPCSDACIGRVIITCGRAFLDHGDTYWEPRDGPVTCPRSGSGGCKFVAFADPDLQPLPPVTDDKATPADIDLPLTPPVTA